MIGNTRRIENAESRMNPARIISVFRDPDGEITDTRYKGEHYEPGQIRPTDCVINFDSSLVDV